MALKKFSTFGVQGISIAKVSLIHTLIVIIMTTYLS